MLDGLQQFRLLQTFFIYKLCNRTIFQLAIIVHFVLIDEYHISKYWQK